MANSILFLILEKLVDAKEMLFNVLTTYQLNILMIFFKKMKKFLKNE
jgi:hypothetical protein